MIIDILIFLIVGGLLFTVTTALHEPLNLIVAVIIGCVIAAITLVLFSWSWFLLLLALWMVLIVGGLYGLRGYMHRHNKKSGTD
ncbi:hypothetical protein [Lacticaseibacillus thailandensis]|uniref:Uncharacterized protein n=1 Tax=Lacticaseibacillus thailandensis DSM 22698 = JCM 13996 TaxID=1423810 RepID=A0A0R2C8Z7_9LACO|nr:hypothetical protein [Lacticaseibacillus thailandensis]KRM88269.1 hypothetical protein FD19_GL000561 [Lacticaseibacillus thailandensis DSM 22698 = JCM 13996]